MFLNEINDSHDKELINFFVNSKRLEVCLLNQKEVAEVVELQQKFGKQLSFTDCTVWFLARKEKIAILTGDKLVRKIAEQGGLNVNGVLFILDSLIEEGIITPYEAITKLKRLIQCNCYLPITECNKRFEKWSKNSV